MASTQKKTTKKKKAPPKPEPPAYNGLARLIGGVLDISSSCGGGTEVKLTVGVEEGA